MQHHLGTELEGLLDELGIGDRPLDHRQPLVRLQAVAPGGREVVDHDHLVAFAQQTLSHVRADETGTAGDQDLGHALLTFLGSGWSRAPLRRLLPSRRGPHA